LCYGEKPEKDDFYVRLERRMAPLWKNLIFFSYFTPFRPKESSLPPAVLLNFKFTFGNSKKL
jgi:hypothetical protein